jgi:GAF domain-containing protein
MNTGAILRWFGIGVSQSDTLLLLQTRFIRALALIGISASAIGAVLLLVTNSAITVRAVVLVFVVLNIGVLVLVQRGKVQIAAYILTTTLAVGALFSPPVYILIGALALIAAAALLNNFLFLVVNILIVGYQIVMVLSAFVGAPADGGVPSAASNGLVVGTALVAVSLATRYFIDQTERAAVAAKQGAVLLQMVAETGEQVGKLLNLNEVLPRAVELIRERFVFNHVQIYLLDEGRQRAVLAASTAAQGQRLYERQNSVEVGAKHAIGMVAAVGRPIIASEREMAAHSADLLLPNTRAQLALPIFDGDRIIGVLDVQSREPGAFNREIEQALQVLTNLLATSIRNARLFDAQDRSTREAKRLFVETEANLREIQRLNQQLTHEGWSDYMREKREMRGVSVNDAGLTEEAVWSTGLERAVETRQPVREIHDGSPIIAVPVMLGGEVIGAIEVESHAGADAEYVEMVKAVAQRLALSLDKARLFEESQAATAREQRINEIVAQFQTVASVDDLLKITLSELSRTFGAQRGAIRLGVNPSAGDAGTNGDSHP